MRRAANGKRGAFRAYRFVGVLLAVVGLAAGCGGGDGAQPVRGKVTYQGQPLQQGTVMFNPTDSTSPPVLGRIADDGTYEVSAAPGEYKVIVTSMTEDSSGLDPDDPGYKAPESLIPEQYSNPLKTPLQATVTEGENTVDLDL